jgi:hypothetical protein
MQTVRVLTIVPEDDDDPANTLLVAYGVEELANLCTSYPSWDIDLVTNEIRAYVQVREYGVAGDWKTMLEDAGQVYGADPYRVAFLPLRPDYVPKVSLDLNDANLYRVNRKWDRNNEMEEDLKLGKLCWGTVDLNKYKTPPKRKRPDDAASIAAKTTKALASLDGNISSV